MAKFTLTAATAAAILAFASATPVPAPAAAPIGPIGGNCYNEVVVSVFKQEPYNKPVNVMSGQLCTSSKDQPCSLGRTFEHSFGIEQTVGISLGGEIEEVFNAGISWSVTWSVTDAKATSVGENCPSGDPNYTCALTASARYVHIEGQKQRIARGGNCEKLGGGLAKDGDPMEEPRPFKFDAPVTVANAVNSADSAQVTWAMCIAPGSPNQTEQAGLPLCNNVAPGQLKSAPVKA